MKKNNGNPNGELKHGVPEETAGSSWGFGSWLRGLGSYLRVPDNTFAVSEPEPTNRRRGDGSRVPVVPSTPKLEPRTAVLRKESVRHSTESKSTLHTTSNSFSVGNSSDSPRPHRTLFESDRSIQSSPQILPRFKKQAPSAAAGSESQRLFLQSNASDGSSNGPGRLSVVTSPYPTYQTQYRGVGVMPSVRLAERERALLTEENSAMLRRPVTIRIAPPDPLASPSSSFCMTPVVSERSAVRRSVSLIDPSRVLSALREKRKRACAEEEADLAALDSDQMNKRQRGNEDRNQSGSSSSSSIVVPIPPEGYEPARGLKRPGLRDSPGDSDTDAESYSNAAKRVRPHTSPLQNVTEPSLSPPRSAALPTDRRKVSTGGGVRNLIDVSYISSRRWLSRMEGQQSLNLSRDGSILETSSDAGFARDLASMSDSRRSSFSSHLLSALSSSHVVQNNGGSEKSSAPPSGRNTPLLSAVAEDGGVTTPLKRTTLVQRDERTGARKRLVTAAALPDIADTLINHRSRITMDDLERDRLVAMRSAQRMISDLDDTVDNKLPTIVTSSSFTPQAITTNPVLSNLATTVQTSLFTTPSTTTEVSTLSSSLVPSAGDSVSSSSDGISARALPPAYTFTDSAVVPTLASVSAVVQPLSSCSLPSVTPLILPSLPTSSPVQQLSAGFVVPGSEESFKFPATAPGVVSDTAVAIHPPSTKAVELSGIPTDLTPVVAPVSASPGGFKFGTGSAASLPFNGTQMPTASVEGSSAAMGGFKLVTSLSAISQGAATQASSVGGFKFGGAQVSSATPTTTVGFGGGASASVFSFGASSKDNPAGSEVVNTAQAASNTTAPVQSNVIPSTFKFGAESKTAQVAVAVTTAPLFGMFSSNQPSSFSSVQQAPFSKVNGLAGASHEGTQSTATSAGMFNAPNTVTFTAGTAAKSQPSSSGLFTFGTASTGSSDRTGMAPAFGLTTSHSVGTSSMFNKPTATTAQSTVPLFGAAVQAASQPQATNPTPFTFGQSAPATMQAQPASFTFGVKPAAGGPVFGQNSSVAQPAQPASIFGANTGSGFGAHQTSGPMFGASTPAANMFSVSAPVTNVFNATAATTNAFGAAVPAVNMFGASAPTTNAFGAATPAANMFNAAPATTNIFNVPPQAANAFISAKPSASAFGAGTATLGVPGSFAFGNAASPNIFTNNNGMGDQPSVNGMVQQKPTVGGGSFQATAAPAQANKGFNFGAAAASTPLFQFGSSAAAPVPIQNTGFNFGAATKPVVPSFGTVNGYAPDVTGMSNAQLGTPPVIGTFAIGQGQATNSRGAPVRTARRRTNKK